MVAVPEHKANSTPGLQKRVAGPTEGKRRPRASSASTTPTPVESAEPSAAAPPRGSSAGYQSQDVAWHAMSIDEVVERLASDRQQGLVPEEAARRLDQCGPNAIQLSLGEKQVPWWRTVSWAVPGWLKFRSSRHGR